MYILDPFNKNYKLVLKAKANENQIKKHENLLAEEHLKKAKLESKLEEFKEKASSKISHILIKYASIRSDKFLVY